MSTKPDGGPAFPTERRVGYRSQSEGGMTLRDYFAGQAIASIPVRNWDGASQSTGKPVTQLWAECAYAVADAMLAERSKEAQP